MNLTARDQHLLLNELDGERVRDRFARFAGAVACTEWAMDCADESSVDHLTFALWRHLSDRHLEEDDVLLDRFAELVIAGMDPLPALMTAIKYHTYSTKDKS